MWYRVAVVYCVCCFGVCHFVVCVCAYCLNVDLCGLLLLWFVSCWFNVVCCVGCDVSFCCF